MSEQQVDIHTVEATVTGGANATAASSGTSRSSPARGMIARERARQRERIEQWRRNRHYD